MDNTHIIVFAKAPTPGQVKTRLASAIGDTAAARLAERMLHETLTQVVAAHPASIELCCTPDKTHPAFKQVAAIIGAVLSCQDGADLGARMAQALRIALDQRPRVMLIGTDCPALDASVLIAATKALASGDDAVFVPALDGGYVLIGLSRFDPELFRDIPWSTARVMAETESRLADLGWRWHKLPPLPDIDHPEDLVHVPATWGSDANSPVSHTCCYLKVANGDGEAKEYGRIIQRQAL